MEAMVGLKDLKTSIFSRHVRWSMKPRTFQCIMPNLGCLQSYQGECESGERQEEQAELGMSLGRFGRVEGS